MNYANRTLIVIAGLLLTFMFVVTACGTSTTSTTTAGQETRARATLNHVPTGTSDLTWDVTSQTLTVTIWMSGLTPNSSHPAHIHKGNCNSNGAILFPLNPVKADASGVGMSVTTIPNDTKAIPQTNWYINVHDGGTGLTPALQDAAVACGNISNPDASTTRNQTVHIVLGATPSPEQSAFGTAKLTLNGSTLTVQLTLGGLVPSSMHMAHIHQGSCEAQGGVVHPLNPVVADTTGNGTSTTTINNVDAIPASGWYVNVHLGANAKDLSTQTGDDPLSCGDVVLV